MDVGKRPPAIEQGLIEALEMVAPGTLIRRAIDNIVRARTGALLVFADETDIRPMISGGIDIDVELAPMILYELAKMDGAILLDRAGHAHPPRQRPTHARRLHRIGGDGHAPQDGRARSQADRRPVPSPSRPRVMW